jgi:hypothetical protein
MIRAAELQVGQPNGRSDDQRPAIQCRGDNKGVVKCGVIGGVEN